MTAVDEELATYSPDDIQVLTTIDDVRRRPGMFVGGTDAAALEHMLFEVVSNSFDEHLAGAANTIAITVTPHGAITVEDNGRGIPIDSMSVEFMERLFTQMHPGPTADGHYPHVHLRKLQTGIGVAPINALSQRFTVESRRQGMAWQVGYQAGRLVEPLRCVGPTAKRGTCITYQPDTTIFEPGVSLDLDAATARMQVLALLAPTLDLQFQGRSLQQPQGLRGWIRAAPNVWVDSILTGSETVDDVDVDFALGWRPTAGIAGDTKPLVRSFVNYAETERGGSHVAGVVAGMRQSARLPRSLSGLVAIVHVRLLHPRFGGPTKALLQSEEANHAVARVVSSAVALAPNWWDLILDREISTASDK
jgi:DNA gyrase subunit B